MVIFGILFLVKKNKYKVIAGFYVIFISGNLVCNTRFMEYTDFLLLYAYVLRKLVDAGHTNYDMAGERTFSDPVGHSEGKE